MRLWDTLDRMIPEALTQAEADGLRQLLLSTPFLKAARLVKVEMDGKRQRFESMNLKDMAGIHEAVNNQGQLAGMARVIDCLSELCPEEEKDASVQS